MSAAKDPVHVVDVFKRLNVVSEAKASADSVWASKEELKKAAWVLVVFQVMMLILYATVGGKPTLDNQSPGTITQGYNMFIGVEIMM